MGKFQIKILKKNKLLGSHKKDEADTLYTCSNISIKWFLLLLPLSFYHYDIFWFTYIDNGKSGFGQLFFYCRSFDTKFQIFPFPTLYRLPTKWTLSKSHILIGFHSSRNAKFRKEISENLLFSSHKGHETESRVSRVTDLVSTTFLLPICLVAMSIWSFHRLIMEKADTVINFWVTADILIKVHRKGLGVVLYQLYEFWLVVIHGNCKANCFFFILKLEFGHFQNIHFRFA